MVGVWWVLWVGVKTTPTHPTSPVNKGTPSIFRSFLVGVDENFSKFISEYQFKVILTKKPTMDFRKKYHVFYSVTDFLFIFALEMME